MIALPISLSSKKSHISSIVGLIVVAVLWGTQHAVIKMVVTDNETSTAAFTFCRFATGLIISIFYTPPVRPVAMRMLDKVMARDDGCARKGGEDGELIQVNGRRSYDAVERRVEEAVTAWRWGLEMGMWMFLGYAFQAIGLQFTTAQRSGFLLYLNVKFVPFFAYLLLHRRITIPTWISALTAFTGTALLSYDGNTSLNIGDLWSIAAAAASAMFILRMEFASRVVPRAGELNAACLWTVTIGALLWLVGESLLVATTISECLTRLVVSYHHAVEIVTRHPVEILYLGVVTTALANYVQTKAQKGITAERASIIYAMDPVYGALFSYLLLGETMGVQGWIGAFLITVAAVTNAFLDLGSAGSTHSDGMGVKSKGSDSEMEEGQGCANTSIYRNKFS